VSCFPSLGLSDFRRDEAPIEEDVFFFFITLEPRVE